MGWFSEVQLCTLVMISSFVNKNKSYVNNQFCQTDSFISYSRLIHINIGVEAFTDNFNSVPCTGSKRRHIHFVTQKRNRENRCCLLRLNMSENKQPNTLLPPATSPCTYCTNMTTWNLTNHCNSFAMVKNSTKMLFLGGKKRQFKAPVIIYIDAKKWENVAINKRKLSRIIKRMKCHKTLLIK